MHRLPIPRFSLRVAVMTLMGVAALVQTGCGALPDMSPFTQSTAKLTSAVRSVGTTSVQEVLLAADAALPPNRDKLKAEAAKLETNWNKIVISLEAAHEYAQSLQAVTDAASQAAASMQEVTNAATQLADTMGVPIGAGAAAGAIARAIQLAYTHIANTKGRKTLKEAMADLAPAIDKIADVLDASLAALDQAVESAGQIQLNALSSNISTSLGYRQTLVEARHKLYEISWVALTTAQKTQLIELKAAIAETDDWYEPYVKERDATSARRATLRRSVGAIQRGVREWAQVHTDIRAALERGGGLDTTALIETIAEIRELVNEVRDR